MLPVQYLHSVTQHTATTAILSAIVRVGGAETSIGRHAPNKRAPLTGIARIEKTLVPNDVLDPTRGRSTQNGTIFR